MFFECLNDFELLCALLPRWVFVAKNCLTGKFSNIFFAAAAATASPSKRNLFCYDWMLWTESNLNI